MCGICGIRRFGPEPITDEQIKSLLLANERRGNQATGLALQNPNENIHVLKSNKPAWAFVTTPEFRKFLDDHLKEETYCFIGHARQATLGDPKDNANNHPLYTGVTAVVHNGHIGNHDHLFEYTKFKRNGEVDSDIIRAIIDGNGIERKTVSELNRMSGSAAIAAISNKYPGKLLLARSGNPLVLAATDHQLLWSSEKDAIHHALRPYREKFGIWMQPNAAKGTALWQTMADDTVYLFTDKEPYLEWHDKFRVANYVYTHKNYEVHKEYRGRKARFQNQEKTDIAQCSYCEKWNTIPETLKTYPLWNITCGVCGHTMEELPKGMETES